jgi:hypothetical protein
MNGDSYRDFLALLQRLDRARIAYRLHHSRDEAVMIEVVVPGERWEIELVDYGDEFQWEVERFRSNGAIEDESATEELFANHAEPTEETAANHERNA